MLTTLSKPVVGSVGAEATALKVLVGFDVLVLYRPAAIKGDVTGQRVGRKLVIRNESNTAQELFEGTQCDAKGLNCQTLDAKRLYAGAVWEQILPYDTPVKYQLTAGNGTRNKVF